MTTSISTPRRSSSGKTVAALPVTPTDSGVDDRFAARHRSTAVSRSGATSSRYRWATRRRSRASSTSTIRQTPPLRVTASGWAPPMPPHPPVRVSVPARVPPNRFAATAAKVS